ncbi:MAG: SprT family zinc-dependent metalloprotease [Pseudomonadota bacterium]
MTERIALDDPETEVVLRRSARARRITLTVPRNGDAPRVTAPPRVSAAEIRMFLLRQADWLREALARAPEIEIVTAGVRLPVAGRELLVIREDGPRRPPRIAGDRLILSGTAPAAPRIAAWLKERARAALLPIVEDSAEAIGARFGRVSLRDPKGRWGSCSSKGDLNFSWRLAMAPPAVLDYVAVHEAAHLREMNHGPRFWALVERLRPDWRDQRNWLRDDGAALHRFRFDG